MAVLRADEGSRVVELPDPMTLARLLAQAYEGTSAEPNKHDYRAAENLIKWLTE